jgi:hypothetical protein
MIAIKERKKSPERIPKIIGMEHFVPLEALCVITDSIPGPGVMEAMKHTVVNIIQLSSDIKSILTNLNIIQKST